MFTSTVPVHFFVMGEKYLPDWLGKKPASQTVESFMQIDLAYLFGTNVANSTSIFIPSTIYNKLHLGKALPVFILVSPCV